MVAHALVIARDVTERRRAEKALSVRAARLRRLHEAALAIAAPVAAQADSKARLLTAIVSGAVEAVEALAGRLVVADDALWKDVVGRAVAPPRDATADVGRSCIAVRHSGGVAREWLRPEGDVAYVLATGEGVFVDDVRAPSRFGPFPGAVARGVGSFAVVPLRAGGRVLGALAVDLERTGGLAVEDREVLELFAAHASAALERAQLLHLERRHAEEQAARAAAEAERARFAFLAEASATLAASLDYEETLRRLADLAVPRLADWCIVYLWEELARRVRGGGAPRETEGSGGPDGRRVQRVAMAFSDPAWEGVARRIEEEFPIDGAAGEGVPRVLRTGKAVLRPSVTAAELAADVAEPARLEALVAPLGVTSWMCVPMGVWGRTLGAISLMAVGSDRRFTPTDLALAEALGRRAALAVESARLYAAERAAVRARDEFLTVAAHELKTPLTSLRGMIQLTLRQREREGAFDPDRIERALRLADRQTGKLAQLVERLLDLSRLETGRLALDLQRLDAAALARETAAGMQWALREHTIAVRVTDAPVDVMGDRLRLEQVLSNLLDNAARHAPAGTTIEVEVTRGRRRWDAPPGVLPAMGAAAVGITVRDRGPGVAPEHRERIFERFFQGTLGSASSGMGLGLYISREIIGQHGGAIWVEEARDGGARFVVLLPGVPRA